MNTKALVKGVRGNAKIAKAFAGGVSKGLAKGAKEASKGLGPVLAALSVAGLIGGELADRGLLSIPVMGKRLPVIGTGLAIISIALGIYMRKRPISRVFYSMGVTFGVCQVIDVIKYGFVVKAQSPAK